MQESRLYPIVAKFVKDKLGCFYVRDKPTVTTHGAVDVVGLRQSSGKYGGSAEVIAVEVKDTTSRLLNAAGQAVGYSVMADRCYLAIRGIKVGDTERELVAQLNVGLIWIGSHGKCEILLTSPQYQPLRAQRLTLIRKLGFVECALCRTLRLRNEMMKPTKNALKVAARDRQGFRYLLTVDHGGDKNAAERRYVCRDCVQVLASSSPV